MSSAIADAGPFLHLHEIGRLNCLKVFERILIPDLVAKELNDLQLGLSQSKISTTITIVAETDWHAIITEVGKPVIHPADAQVFSLARTRQFQETVLTDDLALRRHLENAGATVVGTVGILVRAYSNHILQRAELENAIDALFTTSTLHASHAFKAYVIKLLTDLL